MQVNLETIHKGKGEKTENLQEILTLIVIMEIPKFLTCILFFISGSTKTSATKYETEKVAGAIAQTSNNS